jgi:hypothetical protein
MKNAENTLNEMLEAISLFAEFVVADRNIENVTLAQCEEIAKHALTNLDKVMAAYELGKAGA